MRARARCLCGRSGSGGTPQHGFALLEVTVAAALAALVAVWAADAWVDRVEDAGAQATAQWLAAVHGAMEPALERMEQHARGESPEPLPAALTGHPTIAGLKSLGYLDAGFPERSAWGQPATIRVLQRAGCPGTACRMDVLIHTTVGGAAADQGLRTERVGSVLLAAGGKAGAVHGHAPQRLRGPVFDLPNPPVPGMAALAAGTVAMMVPGSPAQEDVHVRMRDTRDPELQGPLSVAGRTAVGGQLTVGGNARLAGGLDVTANLSARRDLSVGRDMAVTRDARIRRNLSVDGRLSVAGELDGEGRVAAGEYLQVKGRASAGARCSEAGLIGQDGTGALLACNGRNWMTQGGEFGGAYVIHERWGCADYWRQPAPNPRTGDCSCPPGYTPLLLARYLPGQIENDHDRVNAYLCQR